jgi:hypothetical protein
MKVRMPTPNTHSHTRSVLVGTPWATLWCRGPVRVILWYTSMYHFILKTSTFTGTRLLTMGSHHTNRRRGADSLVIYSQNRLWYPKLLPAARSARMGAGKRILHPRRPKTCLLRPRPAPKTPETPKNASTPFGAQWILVAAGRRAALQHRPTADSGRANGWRIAGGTWANHVRSYTTPTLVLGPQLRWGLAEGVDFTAKSGA